LADAIIPAGLAEMGDLQKKIFSFRQNGYIYDSFLVLGKEFSDLV
jgi:hypothetical protein